MHQCNCVQKSACTQKIGGGGGGGGGGGRRDKLSLGKTKVDHHFCKEMLAGHKIFLKSKI